MNKQAKNPIKQALTWVIVAIIIVVGIIALESLRESNGNNPIVNQTINNLESQIVPGSNCPICDCSGWETAFFVLLGIVILALLIIGGIWVYENYFSNSGGFTG